MTTWLDPLRRQLDANEHPVRFFFRDDDVGWSDERLWAMLHRFVHDATPIDLAVIPALLTGSLTSALRRALERSPARVGVHAHGWAHVNHEPNGRPSEFGASRATEDVRADLQRGRAVMDAAFGPASCAVFVPPWNRCSEATAHALRANGFRAVSRDATAEPFGLTGLGEVPITVDWLARRRAGGRVTAIERGDRVATAASGPRPVGVMLHHAVMSDEDLDELDDLAALLHAHPSAALCSMAELFR